MVDIKCENGDVIVTKGKGEVYRAKKSEQNIEIANTIYFYEKYNKITKVSLGRKINELQKYHS